MSPLSTLCVPQAFTKHHSPSTTQLSDLLQNGYFFHYNSFISWRVCAEPVSNWLAGWGSCNFPVRAATHLWKGRVALWVLCMRWWKHLCHLHTSQSLLAGSPRGAAQPSPVSPYCFCKPRICSAQTSASEASSWSCLCLVFLSVFCWLNCSISQRLSCVSVAVL